MKKRKLFLLLFGIAILLLCAFQVQPTFEDSQPPGDLTEQCIDLVSVGIENAGMQGPEVVIKGPIGTAYTFNSLTDTFIERPAVPSKTENFILKPILDDLRSKIGSTDYNLITAGTNAGKYATNRLRGAGTVQLLTYTSASNLPVVS